MFDYGMHAPSINEHIARAQLLLAQLREAQPIKGVAANAAQYSGLRELRRAALTVVAQLKMYQERDILPLVEADAPRNLYQPGLSTGRPTKGSLHALIKQFEQTDFVANNGKAIFDARPDDFGLMNRTWNALLDMGTRISIYSQRHPMRAAGIALAILAAKLLFVYFCWEGLKKAVHAAFGGGSSHHNQAAQMSTAAAN